MSVLHRIVETLPADGVGSFCIVCGDPVRREVANRGVEVFVCANDHYEPRCYLFDGLARWAVEDDRLIHESAGVIIRRDGKTLLFKRARYPLGWTIPAGHIEVGNDPEEEARREAAEEVGLEVVNVRPVWPGPVLIEDSCRRGADWHRWHVFEAECPTGEVTLNEEGKGYAWETDAQIGALGAAGLLIQPVRAIFERIGIVVPRPNRPTR